MSTIMAYFIDRLNPKYLAHSTTEHVWRISSIIDKQYKINLPKRLHTIQHTSNKQLRLNGFSIPFSGRLNPSHHNLMGRLRNFGKKYNFGLSLWPYCKASVPSVLNTLLGIDDKTNLVLWQRFGHASV